MKNQRGYTLIELLIVISALAAIIIAGVAMYTVGHFIVKYW